MKIIYSKFTVFHFLGNLLPNHFGNGKIAGVSAELEHLILRAYEDDPTLSINMCALRLMTNYSAVRLTLKANGMHPWRSRKVQQLVGMRDYVARVQFCTRYLQLCREIPDYSAYILWTDECNFNFFIMFINDNLNIINS